MIHILQESCLKKITYADLPNLKGGYNYASAMKGEELAYQIILYSDEEGPFAYDYELASCQPDVEISLVKQMPVPYPHREDDPYPDYLSDNPCILPDCLVPIHHHGVLTVNKYPTVLWISTHCHTAGEYPVLIHIFNDTESYQANFTLNVVNQTMTKDYFKNAASLFANGISAPYRGDPYTDVYWNHLDRFLTVLEKNGVDQLYLPLFPQICENEIFSDFSQMIKVEQTGILSSPDYIFNYDILDCWLYVAEKHCFSGYIVPSFYPDPKAAN